MDRLRGQASSTNHRQTGWGPHQSGWPDDAYVTMQLRLCHGLAWILTVSWAELKLQDGSHNFALQRSCCTVARACLLGCMCIYCVDCGMYYTGVLGNSACRCVCYTGVRQDVGSCYTGERHERTLISLLYNNRCRVCTCARVCVHSRWGMRVGVYS